MSKINIINPNKIVNGNIENSIGPIEDIRPYFELSYKPRNIGAIILDEKSQIISATKTDTTEIFLNGFVTIGDESFYSTSYVNEIQGNNENNKFYEGFGVKKIDVQLDAHRIPEITITFYDFMGTVMSDENSKFRTMFDLPYPIFYLTLKGGIGPAIKYTLLKTKDDITIDETGSYTITSKFVGDRFSALSDVMLYYLKAVAFLKPNSDPLSGNIDSYYELIRRLKNLYENITEIQESTQQKIRKKEIEDKGARLDILKNIYKNFNLNLNSYIDSLTVESNVKNILKTYKTENDLLIFNFKKQTTFDFVNFNNYESILVNYINIMNERINEPKQYITYNTQFDKELINNDTNTNFIINLREFKKLIDASETAYKVLVSQYSADLNSQIQLASSKQLGQLSKPTASNIFKILLDDYDYLLKLVKNAGDLGDSDTVRYNNNPNFDRIGFPRVIDSNDKIIYPGQINEFKNWPEVKFVDQFINAILTAFITDLTTSSLDKIIDGKSKYIPLNPKEVYTVNSENSINQSNTYSIDNGKVLTFYNVITKILNRYLIFMNINNNKSITTSIGSSSLSIPNLSIEEFVENEKFWDEIESLNITYSIYPNSNIKNFILNLPDDAYSYLKPNVFNKMNNFNDILSKKIITVTDNGILYKFIDNDYSILLNLIDEPTVIDTSNTAFNDIITEYLKKINSDANSEYKLTKQGIVYLEDDLLNQNNFNSQYISSSLLSPTNDISDLINDTLQVNSTKIVSLDSILETFDIGDFKNKLKAVGIYQIPYGLFLKIGLELKYLINENPNLTTYKLSDNVFLYKNTILYNQLLNNIDSFIEKYGLTFFDEKYYLTYNLNVDKNKLIEIRKVFFKKVYFSFNSIAFLSNLAPQNEIETTFHLNEQGFSTYINKLFSKIKSKIKEIDKQFEQQLENEKTIINDNQLKLEVYNSFQLIYETYLYKKSYNSISTFDEFEFYDRTFRDIGDQCILDVSTLLNDHNEQNTDILSSISRLLSKNNFWYYPFQTFTAFNGENFENLFKVDKNIYTNNLITTPKFVCIYVGGLSTNLNIKDSLFKNDGFDENNIPKDYQIQEGDLLVNTFIVDYTGIQNQIIFNNIQHSTEQFKNTDESIRIGSDIVNNGTKTHSFPKGQSLLTLYAKRSYSSTITIPLGNVGIMPTQYYLEKNVALFNGFYIIYNVSHNFENNILSTTFKGYRLSKSTLPLVTEPYVTFNKQNYFSQILENKFGITTNSIEDVGPFVVDGKPITLTETDKFYTELLDKLGAPKTIGNYQFLRAWRVAEGGKAKYNPFNTTLRKGNYTKYNKAGVKNYETYQDGVQATLDTLLFSGQGTYYYNLINELRKGIKTQADAFNVAKNLQMQGKDLYIWVRGPKGTEPLTGYVAAVLKNNFKPITING
jgi:hypothetical protein